MQEFHVVRCFSCQACQVHIIRKDNKFMCKICNVKQSIRKVYGKGSAKDCRRHVQKLNQYIAEKEQNGTVHPSYFESPDRNQENAHQTVDSYNKSHYSVCSFGPLLEEDYSQSVSEKPGARDLLKGVAQTRLSVPQSQHTFHTSSLEQPDKPLQTNSFSFPKVLFNEIERTHTPAAQGFEDLSKNLKENKYVESNRRISPETSLKRAAPPIHPPATKRKREALQLSPDSTTFTGSSVYSKYANFADIDDLS